MDEEPRMRLDESRGTVVEQAIENAPGYPDQVGLRGMARKAFSHVAPESTRLRAQDQFSAAINTYAPPIYGKLVDDLIDQTKQLGTPEE